MTPPLPARPIPSVVPPRPIEAGSPVVLGPDGASLRSAFQSQLRNVDRLDVAVSRIRLDTLGPIPGALERVIGIRILVGELRAADLDAEAHGLAVRPDGLRRLQGLLALVRAPGIEVRASPLSAWSPDFSVFRGPTDSALVGSHAFGRGAGGDGPLWMVRIEAANSVLQLRSAFEECWSRAHPVTPAVETILRRARRWGVVDR